MDGLPKDGGTPYPGNPAGQAQCACHFRGGEFDAPRAIGLHLRKLAKRIGGAVGDELAVIDISDVAAALGFVHVVRGNKESDAVPGELEQQVPKLAPRDRIDARGRLVEKKQLGFVQHGAAERQALLPSAGKLGREPL